MARVVPSLFRALCATAAHLKEEMKNEHDTDRQEIAGGTWSH
jgi:hypothetical protein